VIVRFLVGTPQEDALIKVYSKLYSNFDRMPPGVSQPLIKARSIDDVPILAMTLWGEHYNGYQLRAVADEMQHNIAQISDVSETTIIGGLPRTMRVVLSTEKLSAYGLSPMAIVGHLQAANASVRAGHFSDNNQEICVDAGNLFTRREDLEAVVVGVIRGIRCICATWLTRLSMAPRIRRTTWSTERRMQVPQHRRARASTRP